MTCIRPGDCAVCQESIRDSFGSAYGKTKGQNSGEGQWCECSLNSAGGGGRWVRAGGCGLPGLDLEGEERAQEVGAD